MHIQHAHMKLEKERIWESHLAWMNNAQMCAAHTVFWGNHKEKCFLDYLTDIVFLHTLSSLALLCDAEFAVVITKWRTKLWSL